jgi:hypothetical protein
VRRSAHIRSRRDRPPGRQDLQTLRRDNSGNSNARRRGQKRAAKAGKMAPETLQTARRAAAKTIRTGIARLAELRTRIDRLRRTRHHKKITGI